MSKKKSIRQRLTMIGIFPIVLLGILILVFGAILIYVMNANAIRDELETSTSVLKGCFDLTVRGDYTYDKLVLKKGDVNITDSTMLYEIKENSGVDTTIFWEDTRVLTTIENEYGVSAVGTQASADVVETVLKHANDFYSFNLIIGDVGYIGYYTPLMNEDGTVVGMVFAGRPQSVVYQKIIITVAILLVVTLIVILFALVSWKRYSNQLIVDVESINTYLHNIMDGDLNVTIESGVISREDEIGQIGIHAVRMCDALKVMVEQDPLTMLYNRRTCNRMIQKLVEEKINFTIVMGDIDFFKKINDQYGHACGDSVLKKVSSIIKDNVIGCGFAARWGGEEFLLIYVMEHLEAKQKVEALAQTIRDTIFQYEENEVRVTMTIGVQEMDFEDSYEKMIKLADDKLYSGKRNGRNQIVL